MSRSEIQSLKVGDKVIHIDGEIGVLRREMLCPLTFRIEWTCGLWRMLKIDDPNDIRWAEADLRVMA
jgi:hypothetical protein